MNYRHIFHAGNFADVVKHLALIDILNHLARKPGGYAVIDTHAGRGAYDVWGLEATRTGEAAAGIGRLSGIADADALLAQYLSLAANRPDYPGSPLIAARLIRAQDRLVAVEKHPEEAAQLAAVLHPFRRVKVVSGNGYEQLPILLPPPERRGVVLIDPPFEQSDEFAQAARAFAAAYRRFATGVYVIWFPIKSQADVLRFCGEILDAGAKNVLRVEIKLNATPADGRLAAAGLVVVNPPFGFAERVGAALAAALPLLEAGVRFVPLRGE